MHPSTTVKVSKGKGISNTKKWQVDDGRELKTKWIHLETFPSCDSCDINILARHKMTNTNSCTQWKKCIFGHRKFPQFPFHWNTLSSKMTHLRFRQMFFLFLPATNLTNTAKEHHHHIIIYIHKKQKLSDGIRLTLNSPFREIDKIFIDLTNFMFFWSPIWKYKAELRQNSINYRVMQRKRFLVFVWSPKWPNESLYKMNEHWTRT